jgi:hypothetical protein
VTVPDEVTPGELDRRLRDHEQRTDRIHAEQDNRIARVASDSVSAGVYASDQRARDREVQDLRDEIKEVRDRPALTVGRIVMIGTALIALAALLVQAWGTLKGAK